MRSPHTGVNPLHPVLTSIQQRPYPISNAPILILTAKDTIVNKVMGLDARANDYLVKPVDMEELLARVRALRRRSPLWIGDKLHLKGLILYLDAMRVEY